MSRTSKAEATPKPPNRVRPMLVATVDPMVRQAVQDFAARHGTTFSSATETLLARALGLATGHEAHP